MQMHANAWPTPDPGRGRYRPQGAGGRSDAPGSAWAKNGKALFPGPYHTSAALTTWADSLRGLVKKVWKLWNICSIIQLHTLSKKEGRQERPGGTAPRARVTKTE